MGTLMLDVDERAYLEHLLENGPWGIRVSSCGALRIQHYTTRFTNARNSFADC